jgi:hypothetical protein
MAICSKEELAAAVVEALFQLMYPARLEEKEGSLAAAVAVGV